jgi:hypothetical protein
MSDDIRQAILEAMAPAVEMQRLAHKAMLTTEEVAQLYGIAAGTLENMRCQNRGPAYTQLARGGKVLYSRQNVDSWLAAQAVQPRAV